MSDHRPDFQAIFEAAPAMYMVLDPQLRIVAATDEYCKATLTVRADILGRHVFDVFPENPADPNADAIRNSKTSFQRVLQTRLVDVIGVQWSDVCRPPAEGGGFEVRYWNIVNSPVLNPDRSLAYILHRVENVTDFVLLQQERLDRARMTDVLRAQAAQMESEIAERRRAEEALATAVQRLSAHMDNSPLAVVEFDPAFRVIRWSKEAERVFGWRAEEILGRAIGAIRWVYDEDTAKVQAIAEAMVEGRAPRNLSVNRNYRKDGAVIECEWYNSAIYDSKGELASVLSQIVDVTARNRSEERLRQAQKLESLGLLAGGVAHDFNNLLVGVIGNASMAQDMLPPEHPVATLLDAVVTAGEEAAHLTRQMLAYSGKGKFVVHSLDISIVIPEMLSLVRHSISKKITIQLDLAESLPTIEADRGQFQQIFTNLVVNAAEAIGDRAGLITIRTVARDLDADYIADRAELADLTPGTFVCLEVRDTGSGMDESTRSRIFDPFFSTKFTGRGLGLAAVAGIVRGHKGAIAVTSEPGRGSSFTVLFPAGASSAGQSPLEKALAESPGSGAVLVVDDEAIVCEMAKQSLEPYGYTVLVADSGLGAIDALKNYPGGIGAIILDLNAPGIEGLETLLELRKISPGVKVVLSSAHSEEEGMVPFERIPVSGFLQKPYSAGELAQRVRKALSGDF